MLPDQRIEFVKGHGTENDFVLMPDPDGTLELNAAQVRAICDRRAGLGADGIIRIAPDGDRYFMDYRNADGSLAEMCGNGARLFARFLVDAGWIAPGTTEFTTRGGVRTAEVPAAGDVTIHLGSVRLGGASAARLGDRQFTGRVVDVGNPHLVCPVDLPLAELDLATAPEIDAAVFPEGANVEFVRAIGPDHIAMRVFERGVGETRSCGTGTAAAAAATPGHGSTVRVRVPGGEVAVGFNGDQVLLTGPAVIVARGHIDPGFWAAQA